MDLRHIDKEVIKLIQNNFTDRENLKVLDLGSGTTQASIELVEHIENIIKVICVDDDRHRLIEEYFERESNFSLKRFSEEYASIAGQHIWYDNEDNLNKIEFIPQSIENYTQSSNHKFDLIIFQNILHFYTNPLERKVLLNSMGELLKTNGKIYIQVASKNNNYNRHNNKVVFDLSMLEDEFEETNLAFVSAPIPTSKSWHFMLKNKPS